MDLVVEDYTKALQLVQSIVMDSWSSSSSSSSCNSVQSLGSGIIDNDYRDMDGEVRVLFFRSNDDNLLSWKERHIVHFLPTPQSPWKHHTFNLASSQMYRTVSPSPEKDPKQRFRLHVNTVTTTANRRGATTSTTGSKSPLRRSGRMRPAQFQYPCTTATTAFFQSSRFQEPRPTSLIDFPSLCGRSVSAGSQGTVVVMEGDGEESTLIAAHYNDEQPLLRVTPPSNTDVTPRIVAVVTPTSLAATPSSTSGDDMCLWY